MRDREIRFTVFHFAFPVGLVPKFGLYAETRKTKFRRAAEETPNETCEEISILTILSPNRDSPFIAKQPVHPLFVHPPSD